MSNTLKNLFFLIIIFLSACSGNGDKTSSKNELVQMDVADSSKSLKVKPDAISEFGYFKPDGDSLIIPSFEIEVNLSPKAKAKLSKDNETIIVNASFMGIPKDTTSDEFLQSGEMGIAGKDIELKDEKIAKFENIKFPKSLYDSLSDKDIQLLINVFSGRKSSPDNLLNCGIIHEKMSKIKGGKFTIDCKLIYGED